MIFPLMMQAWAGWLEEVDECEDVLELPLGIGLEHEVWTLEEVERGDVRVNSSDEAPQ